MGELRCLCGELLRSPRSSERVLEPSILLRVGAGELPQHSVSPVCNINYLLGRSSTHVFLFLGAQLDLWGISVQKARPQLFVGIQFILWGELKRARIWLWWQSHSQPIGLTTHCVLLKGESPESWPGLPRAQGFRAHSGRVGTDISVPFCVGFLSNTHLPSAFIPATLWNFISPCRLLFSLLKLCNISFPLLPSFSV